MKIRFIPISFLLKSIEKTDCLFCLNKATKSAHYGVAEIRCCDRIECTNSAMDIAEHANTLTGDQSTRKNIKM